MVDEATEQITAIEDALLQLMQQMEMQRSICAGRLGLSPPQALALRYLEEAQPMRGLAGHLHCDASYITGIVDGLEAHGLVQRRGDPQDRRVKQLVLTEAGRVTREQLLSSLAAASPLAHALSTQERTQLHSFVERCVSTTKSERCPSTPKVEPLGCG